MGKNGREVMWGRHDKSNVWSIGQWVNKALMHSSPNPENRTDWSINQSIMAHIYHLILKTDNQLTDQSIMIHTRSSPNPKKQSTDWSVNQLWHNGWTKSNHTLNQSINPNNPSTSFNHQINLVWHINEYSHFNCHTGFRIKYKTQNPFFSFSVQVCEQISIKIHSTEVDLLHL